MRGGRYVKAKTPLQIVILCCLSDRMASHATTVGAGCCLGAALAPTAGAEDLQTAYAAFQAVARTCSPTTNFGR